MIIKKRPIITWLLNRNDSKAAFDIVVSPVCNPINRGLLFSYLGLLNDIREKNFPLELPEMIMHSFEEVMKKSERSFEKIMPELFKEFSKSKEHGILLCQGKKTIVYHFIDNELHLWCFTEQDSKSVLNFYSCNKSINGFIGVGIANTILADDMLFKGTLEERKNTVAFFAHFVALYLAVKKYIKVETVVIPQGIFTEIEGTPLEYVEKKKVINQTGQEVIVMDSKYFRKIINNNDIYVRGFWRMQNKKDGNGNWYKQLIFIDPFVRHGYHRDAKIEMNEKDKET